MRKYPKNVRSSDFDWTKIKWTKYKIVVPTKADEKELRDAFRHIHDSDINTDYIAVNQLAHEYLEDNGCNIVVDKELYESLNKKESK